MMYRPVIRKNSTSSSSSWTSRAVKTPPSTTIESVSVHTKTSMSPHSSTSTFTFGNTLTSAPEPGNTYKILEIDSERAITLVGGRLTLVLDAGTRGGWHWECEEHPGGDGWIGFRDAVSGRYLGHDNKGGYIVQASKFDGWESFVLRPRAAGGYNLCVRYGNKLKPMGISDNDGSDPKLVDAQSYEKAARWAFYKV
ncbi:hypothetical protein F4801DRAFT_470474 [Xylaria longipes]|nr:hypothetical protein F4801DRAFT_470474 [Xylaria longipes]